MIVRPEVMFSFSSSRFGRQRRHKKRCMQQTRWSADDDEEKAVEEGIPQNSLEERREGNLISAPPSFFPSCSSLCLYKCVTCVCPEKRQGSREWGHLDETSGKHGKCHGNVWLSLNVPNKSKSCLDFCTGKNAPSSPDSSSSIALSLSPGMKGNHTLPPSDVISHDDSRRN